MKACPQGSGNINRNKGTDKMRKQLFSVCLLMVCSLSWAHVPLDHGADYLAKYDIMQDVTAGFDEGAGILAVAPSEAETRSMATVARAEYTGEGYRTIGSGSSGGKRLGISTTASNPPDI